MRSERAPSQSRGGAGNPQKPGRPSGRNPPLASYGFILAFGLGLFAIMFCAKPQPAATSPAVAQPNANGPRIIFPDNSAVRLEIAADDETRTQGLMYRDRLPEGTGMLFFFPLAGDYPFWMKNTLIPLDLIWIDADHKIVHVAYNVPPCKSDPCPSYPPHATAAYVLEVAGGVAAQHHLADGQTLRFEGLDHVVVR